MRRRADRENKFLSIFDEKTGFYYRSGVMERGRDTGNDPFMAGFPEIIEVEIMGSSAQEINGNGTSTGKPQANLQESRFKMTVEDFASIAKQCRGKTYQLILGGSGEAYLHERFEEILKICVQNEIVPNVAASGFGITEEKAALCGKYCGAAALDWRQSPDTWDAIRMLQEAGVKTNIHFALGKQTIQEAVERLEQKSFPQGVNAVIFLTHKSAGLKEEGGILDDKDERVRKFISLVDGKQYPFKVGFDSCGILGLLRFAEQVDFNSVIPCEGAGWSAYISSDMEMMPCRSACGEGGWRVNLRTHSIQEAWESGEFSAFREIQRSVCRECVFL